MTLVAEIVAEPRDAGFEAKGIDGIEADEESARLRYGGGCSFPQRGQVFARGEELSAGAAGPISSNEAAGDSFDDCFQMAVLGKGSNVHARDAPQQFGGLRACNGERAGGRGFIGEDDVIHDDEFFDRGGGGFARAGVRDADHRIDEREGLDLGENMALGIEKQPDRALSGHEVTDVAGEDGVQIARAIRAREAKKRMEIGVREDDRLAGSAIFRFGIREARGKFAAQVRCDGRAGGAMQVEQWILKGHGDCVRPRNAQRVTLLT